LHTGVFFSRESSGLIFGSDRNPSIRTLSTFPRSIYLLTLERQRSGIWIWLMKGVLIQTLTMCTCLVLGKFIGEELLTSLNVTEN
jgi:hypothetical protein